MTEQEPLCIVVDLAQPRHSEGIEEPTENAATKTIPTILVRVGAGTVGIELRWPPGAGTGPSATLGAVPDLAVPTTSPGDGHLVLSPAVGVFYRSPSPGAPPFVGLNDVVFAGEQVGIVEAMKLMIPVESSRAGRIELILAEDADAVEYSTPLFALAPLPETER